jgi:hypothetical protein
MPESAQQNARRLERQAVGTQTIFFVALVALITFILHKVADPEHRAD